MTLVPVHANVFVFFFIIFSVTSGTELTFLSDRLA